MDIKSRVAKRLTPCLALIGILALAAMAPNALAQSDEVVWTGVIPDIFPHNVYTWRLSTDGSYAEDAVDTRTRRPAQATLSGCWKADGMRMVLWQDKIDYVFDGIVNGPRYTGTLYLNGRSVSRFCAVKGNQAPQECAGEPGATASTSLQSGCAQPVNATLSSTALAALR